MFKWLEFKRGKMTPEEIAEDAMQRVKDGIDAINENLPLLPRNYGLWIDRSHRPPRVCLTDWSDSTPAVVHGDR